MKRKSIQSFIYYLYKKQAFYQIFTDASQLSSVPHLSCTVTHLSCMQFSHLSQPMCVREDDSNYIVEKDKHTQKKSRGLSQTTAHDFFFLTQMDVIILDAWWDWHEGVNFPFVLKTLILFPPLLLTTHFKMQKENSDVGAPLNKMVGLNYDPKLPVQKSVLCVLKGTVSV